MYEKSKTLAAIETQHAPGLNFVYARLKYCSVAWRACWFVFWYDLWDSNKGASYLEGLDKDINPAEGSSIYGYSALDKDGILLR